MSISQHERIYPADSYVRQVMDPYDTLPYVVMDRDCSGMATANTFRLLQERELVGWASFGENPETNCYHFSYIEVDKQGEGIGLAAYLVAIEMAHSEDKTFTCDKRVTERARRVWKRFVSVGVAEVIQPFVELPRVRIDPTVYYSGVVRINPRGSHG